MWATIHQLGYWWADHDAERRPISGRAGWGIAATALVGLVAVTWGGLYPVAMVGVPGEAATNMTPPTFALALLGLAQAGLILGTQGPVRQLTARHGAWRGVIAVSGVIMTVYLWHLSAMSLVAAGGLYAFGGAAFQIEPGTTAWWLTRPLWLLVLVGATALLVMTFARFEWLIRTDHLPTRVRHVAAGVLLCAGSAGAVAWWGLAAADATINWIIPLAAVAGAALIGAYPRRTVRTTARAPVRGPSR